ncbi:hypothetical protein ACKAV7_007050 [Fusarium commune]
MNAFITLIEPLELADSRALRIVVASAVLWGTIGLLALAWWICKQLFDEGALPYPVVGDPNAPSLEENLIRGMQKYRDSPFVLAGSRPPLLILPISVFHECHNMPNDCISIIAEHENKLQGKYTHVTTIRPEFPVTIRQDVTRNMPNIIQDFQDELAYACEQWPRTSNWTSVPLYDPALVSLNFRHSKQTGNEVNDTIKWSQATQRIFRRIPRSRNSALPYPFFGH